MSEKEHPQQKIGAYQLWGVVGTGSNTIVYRASSEEGNTQFALKMLKTQLVHQDDFVKKLRQCIEVVNKLDHENIAHVFEVGIEESSQSPYLIMPFLGGGSLKQHLLDNSLSKTEMIWAFSQIASALDAAHGIGIWHQDIKPGNILFDDKKKALLTDFGLIQKMDTTIHASGMPNVVAYMSPEQFNGEAVDGRSDQYSLGVVVFEALTGQLPFQGNLVQVMNQHINKPAPLDQLNNQQMAAIVGKALAKNRTDRFATVGEFIGELQNTLFSGGTLLSHDATNIVGSTSTTGKEPESASPETLAIPDEDRIDTHTAVSPEETAAAPVEEITKTTVIEKPREKDVGVVAANAAIMQETTPKDPHATFIVNPVPDEPIQPDSQPSLELVESPLDDWPPPAHTQPSIKEGAGGTETILPDRPTRKWLYAVLAGLVCVVILFSILFLSEKSETSAPGIIASSPTGISPSCEIFIRNPTRNTTYRIGETGGPLPADGKIPCPNEDKPLLLHTSTDPISIDLNDDLQLYFAPETEITYYATSRPIELNQGRLVVVNMSGAVTVTTPFDSLAINSEAGKMGVGYSENPYTFEIDCFEGACEGQDKENHEPFDEGRASYLKDGDFVIPIAARNELYDFATVVPTPTELPAGTAVPSPTPLPTAISSTPTYTPTPQPTETVTPTDTPTLVRRTEPRITQYTCSNPGDFNNLQTIDFTWTWNDFLRDENEYLEVRVGPRGGSSELMRSIGTNAIQEGNNWILTISAADIFDENAYELEWEVALVRVSNNRPFTMARSGKGCLSVKPN